MPCGEVEVLSGSDRLWRRVYDHPDSLEYFPDEDRWLPKGSPPAVQFDPDLSMTWREHLERRHRLGPEAIIADSGHALVFEMSVDDAEILGCAAEHSPVGDEPVDCAHASILYPPLPNDLTRNQRKSEQAAVRNAVGRAMRRVHGSVTQPKPPGA